MWGKFQKGRVLGKRGEKNISRNNPGTLYKNNNNALWVLWHRCKMYDNNNTKEGKGENKAVPELV